MNSAGPSGILDTMKIHKKFVVVSATVALAVLGLTSCGDDSDTTTDDRQSSQTPGSQTPGSQTPTSSPTESDGGGDGAETPDTPAQSGAGADAESVARGLAAVVAAEEHLTGTAYELSVDDGRWEVDVAVGDRSHEVRVTQDGSVAGADEDSLDGDDRAALEAAEVTLTDAIETAAGAAPGGRLDDVSLDDDGRGYTWEVSFEGGGVDHEIHVDVVSGEIVRSVTGD